MPKVFKTVRASPLARATISSLVSFRFNTLIPKDFIAAKASRALRATPTFYRYRRNWRMSSKANWARADPLIDLVENRTPFDDVLEGVKTIFQIAQVLVVCNCIAGIQIRIIGGQ